jgi:hypothetical protein
LHIAAMGRTQLTALERNGFWTVRPSVGVLSVLK